jgi:hypothetical protein
MNDSDKRAFFDLLKPALEMGGRPLTADTAALWWKALEPYDLPEIEAAVVAALRDPETGRYPLTTGAVIAHIPDPWGTPDEAWALALRSRDEAASLCVLPEILEALGVAGPILDEGDTIGGRRAFIESYQRIVKARKLAGARPQWQLSIGHDPGRRAEAAREAVDRRLLPREAVEHYLPAPDASGPVAAVAGLLAGKSASLPDAGDDRTRERLRDLLAAVRGRPAADPPAAAAAAARDRVARIEDAKRRAMEGLAALQGAGTPGRVGIEPGPGS